MKTGILMVLMILLLSISLHSNTITLNFVCEDQEDFPFVMGKGNEIPHHKPGAVIELLRLLEKESNIKINFVRVPWRRALESELKNGRADALFHASYRKDREEFGVYPMKNNQIDESKKLFATTYSFYRIKGSNVNWDGKELKNFTGIIDAPRGYSIVNDLKNMSYRVDESESTTNGFQKLLADRVQLVAALEYTGDNLLSKNPEWAGKIEKIEIPITSRAYYLMFSHQFYDSNKELADQIWNTLVKIRDKELAEIINKYM